MEDRWLFANGEKGSQVVNTTRLSSTSWTVMADGACFLVVVIVHVGETCTPIFVKSPRVSFFFCFFRFLLLLLYFWVNLKVLEELCCSELNNLFFFGIINSSAFYLWFFFLQIQLLDKTFRRTLTKPTLDHLARNNMVREVDHYNGVKYFPSTTNNPFTEKQRYRMIKKKHCSLVFSSHFSFNKR